MNIERRKTVLRLTPLLLLVGLIWQGLSGCNSDEGDINSPGAGDRWVFTKVSGDNQQAVRLDTLPQRLVVKLEKLNGTAIDNEQIRFYLVQGKGQVLKPVTGFEYFDLITITDFAGIASAQFQNLGGDSLGMSQVKAEIFDSAQFSVIFTIGTI